MKQYTEIIIDLTNGEVFTLYVPRMTFKQRAAESERLLSTYDDIIGAVGMSDINEKEIQ
jgi:hypothetical protein